MHKQCIQQQLPLSPQSVFHELATSQYGVPFSTPQPSILTAWPPSSLPVTCWYTPTRQQTQLTLSEFGKMTAQLTANTAILVNASNYCICAQYVDISFALLRKKQS